MGKETPITEELGWSALEIVEDTAGDYRLDPEDFEDDFSGDHPFDISPDAIHSRRGIGRNHGYANFRFPPSPAYLLDGLKELAGHWVSAIQEQGSRGLSDHGLSHLREKARADFAHTRESLNTASPATVALWLKWHRDYVRKEIARLVAARGWRELNPMVRKSNARRLARRLRAHRSNRKIVQYLERHSVVSYEPVLLARNIFGNPKESRRVRLAITTLARAGEGRFVPRRGHERPNFIYLRHPKPKP